MGKYPGKYKIRYLLGIYHTGIYLKNLTES